MRLKQKGIACVLALSILNAALPIPTAHAGFVGVETLLQAEQRTEQRLLVQEFLQREGIAHQLTAWGVNPAEAAARVVALSDEEVAKLAADIENLPAGSGVGAVIGAAVLIFLVLLVTDILGLTKVYPFTRSVR